MATIQEFTGEYRFLSNFYLAPVEWNGTVWPSSEHAYQAAKTLDLATQELIRNLPTPAAAKKAGKLVKMRSDWDDVKVLCMLEILRSKFTLNADLRAQLLATGDAHLEEGNWWKDVFWGVCPVGSGRGLNMLGKLLMEVRAECALNPMQV